MAVNREEFFEQGAIVLTPTDELFTAEVVQEIHACIDSTAMRHAIINFQAIRFLHATPFTPLLKLHQQLQQDGRRLVLCHLSSELADVFRITRFDQIFEIQPNRRSALSGIA